MLKQKQKTFHFKVYPKDLRQLVKQGFGSQEHFANQMGVNRQTVARWVKNNDESVLKSYIKPLTNALDTDEKELILWVHQTSINDE